MARAILPGAFAVIALTIPIAVGMGLGNALMVVAVKERFADRPLLITGVYASGIQLGAARHDRARGADRRLRRFLAGADAGLLAGGRRIACVVARRDARRRPAPGRQARPFPAAQARRMALRRALRDLGLRLLRLRRVAARRVHASAAGRMRTPASSSSRSTCSRSSPRSSVTLAGDRFHWSRRALLTPPGVFLAVGALGIALDPSHALFWCCMLGIGNGAIFPLMMTLPLDAADRPEQVAGVVGMMLGIGYCAGALAPVAIGALRDSTGSFDAGLWLHRRDGDRRPVHLCVVHPCPPGPRRAGCLVRGRRAQGEGRQAVRRSRRARARGRRFRGGRGGAAWLPSRRRRRRPRARRTGRTARRPLGARAGPRPRPCRARAGRPAPRHRVRSRAEPPLPRARRAGRTVAGRTRPRASPRAAVPSAPS